MMLGMPTEDVLNALGEAHSVQGRCEVLYAGEYTIIRDFAHTGRTGWKNCFRPCAPL